jgi:malonate decarboxylase delta subunit
MEAPEGLERLHFEFPGGKPVGHFVPALVGVVGSGNLEVLVEPQAKAACTVDVATSARGFANIWQAVMHDFRERHPLAGLRVSINDMGATPAVVRLRLDQAVAELAGARP